MKGTFRSGAFTLACHLTVPSGTTPGQRPAVILCHGFPIGPIDARRSGGTFPQLIDRIAHDLGYVGMTFNFRGTGTSGGDFSLQGWVDDLRTAIDHVVAETSPSDVVLVGTNTGGSIAICVAADDPRVRCAALLSPTIPAGSSNTPATSVRSRRRDTHLRSRNGAGHSGASARSTAPVGSLHGRCS